jgi:hypothetical protein
MESNPESLGTGNSPIVEEPLRSMEGLFVSMANSSPGNERAAMLLYIV